MALNQIDRDIGVSSSKEFIEIGVVSKKEHDLEEKARNLAVDFQKSVTAVLDGRKTRHMQFEWMIVDGGSPRVHSLLEKQEEADNRFQTVKMTPELCSGAEIFSQAQAREILRELSQAKFARERDILSRRGRKAEEVKSTLSILKSTSLVNPQYLLECKQTSNPLGRFGDPNMIQTEAATLLSCPACNRKFSEELLTEGYIVSEVGQRLLEKSHWMTVWVTNVLLKLGIPDTHILWNLSEAGEEIDIVADCLGQLWIFELKDREFGAGDAYPLNYRLARYKADKAFIITTERVSQDARRVLAELQPPPRRGIEAQGNIMFIFIEGLEQCLPKLGLVDKRDPEFC